MDPDKILNKETMMKPYRTIIDRRENEERMMILQKTIKNAIIDEIKSADDRTWSMVAREKFELRPEAPKAPRNKTSEPHSFAQKTPISTYMISPDTPDNGTPAPKAHHNISEGLTYMPQMLR